MKKLLAILSILALSACATVENVTFDNVQYKEFVELKVLTDAAIPNCSAPTKIVTYSKAALEKVILLKTYVSYRESEQKLLIATTNLTDMVTELENRYANIQSPPSSTYCTLKLTNIGEGTSTILYTLGRMK